jgi:hypothetical protein
MIDSYRFLDFASRQIMKAWAARQEAGVIPTVALWLIPDLTRAVGAPRLAGISYPMGQPLGRPHDAEGQRAVLRAMFQLLANATGGRPSVTLAMPASAVYQTPSI